MIGLGYLEETILLLVMVMDDYFKVALRTILHRKAFTAINLIGLTFGVSAVLLIGMYLKYELTYDRATPDHDRILSKINATS